MLRVPSAKGMMKETSSLAGGAGRERRRRQAGTGLGSYSLVKSTLKDWLSRIVPPPSGSAVHLDRILAERQRVNQAAVDAEQSAQLAGQGGVTAGVD